MLKISLLNFSEIKTALNSPKNIVITTHISPDADAIGSSVGLAETLNKLGHRIEIIVPDIYPDFLNWMDTQKQIVAFDWHHEKAKRLINNADIIFSLDYNKLSRIGDDFGDEVLKATATKVLIDHHRDPDEFPDFTISDTSASSTSELIWDFLVDLEIENLQTQLGAEALYAGIMTDTGNFRFNSTSSKTHETVAKLMRIGVEVDKVYNRIYDQNSITRLKLLGHILDNRMKVFPELNSIYFWLTLEDKKKFNVKKGDTEGFVNYGLSIKGMNFSTFITEDDDKVKFSFRSKGEFNVHEFSNTHFGGGGHFNAAGGRSLKSLEETISKFENALIQSESQLVKPFEV